MFVKILAAALALASLQSPTSTGPKPRKALDLLAPQEVDPARLLPPPAAEGSGRAKAELAELHRIADAVSPARMAQARWDDEHEDPSMLEPVLGPAFDLKALPQTADLLALVKNDAGVSSSTAKAFFNRKRPWAVDPSLKTCDPDDKPLTSYPSGHATLGYSLSLTMAILLPKRAQALMERASDYAYSREVCGSHFASDTQASQALATAMITALQGKPEFQAKLKAARRELRAHGLADE